MRKLLDKLYKLEQIQPTERIQVGDKAFYLSRVMQQGYPVIPGFVVPADVLWEFLSTLNSTEPLMAELPNSSLHIDVDDSHQLQHFAQRLQQKIISATLPSEWLQILLEVAQQWRSPTLIFRPSLALKDYITKDVKIAGLLEAQVCNCEAEAIALALKSSWSQLFRARSLLFWQRHQIEWRELNLAVLVQPFRNAIASGCLNYNSQEIEIKASWGLGIALTRGEVLPDCYIVDAASGAVRSSQLGNKMLAYSLANSPFQADLTPCATPLLVYAEANCLQTYLLSEKQQQEYALNEINLQQLIQLARQLGRDLSSAFTLEWTLTQSNNSAQPQLYITQVTANRSQNSEFRRNSPSADSALPASSALISPSADSAPPASSALISPPARHHSIPHTSNPIIKGLAAASGRVVGKAYVITHPDCKPEIPPKAILVAPAIAPDWLPLLQQAAGIVTQQGGLTSHSAILARELGIPAVVNATNATKLIQTGESLVLDGDRGEVYRVSRRDGELGKAEGAQGAESAEGEDIATRHSPLTTRHSYVASYPPLTTPIATQLLVNLSQPSSIERVKNLPVDGVGLLRSELMGLNVLAGQHPKAWIEQGRRAELVDLWQDIISQFASAFAPRPVFYRSLDWRSHEFPSLAFGYEPSMSHSTTNPLLGQRGTFSYVRDATIFDLELEALTAVQQFGYTNIHLLLPFVRTVEEFSFCRRRVEQAGLTNVAQFQLWIMAEVPSILFLLPEFVKAGVQGISIGTNDLTQLLLGVDRDEGELAAAFDERHPVVMQAIAQIIEMARSAHIPCSICGQAPVRYPELIDSLVRWGITSISVEPEAVEQTYTAIANAEQRLLLEVARNSFRS